MSFAAAQASDIEELVAMRIEAMRESLERIGRFDPIRARERLVAGFSPECTRFIVSDGVRVGFVVVKPEGDALRLDHLYVRPAAQGQGVGAAVLAEVIAQADGGLLAVDVTALRGSDANRFYLRHGFQAVAQTEFDTHYRRPSTSHSSGELDR